MSAPAESGFWYVPCCGWMGRIFGHSYREFPLKETPPETVPFDCQFVSDKTISEYIDRMTHREYALRCRRCGAL